MTLRPGCKQESGTLGDVAAQSCERPDGKCPHPAMCEQYGCAQERARLSAAKPSRRKADLTRLVKWVLWTNRHTPPTSRISNWLRARSAAPSRIETRRSRKLCSPVFLLLSSLALSASRGSGCGRSGEQQHRSGSPKLGAGSSASGRATRDSAPMRTVPGPVCPYPGCRHWRVEHVEDYPTVTEWLCLSCRRFFSTARAA